MTIFTPRSSIQSDSSLMLLINDLKGVGEIQSICTRDQRGRKKILFKSSCEGTSACWISVSMLLNQIKQKCSQFFCLLDKIKFERKRRRENDKKKQKWEFSRGKTNLKELPDTCHFQSLPFPLNSLSLSSIVSFQLRKYIPPALNPLFDFNK